MRVCLFEGKGHGQGRGEGRPREDERVHGQVAAEGSGFSRVSLTPSGALASDSSLALAREAMLEPRLLVMLARKPNYFDQQTIKTRKMILDAIETQLHAPKQQVLALHCLTRILKNSKDKTLIKSKLETYIKPILTILNNQAAPLQIFRLAAHAILEIIRLVQSWPPERRLLATHIQRFVNLLISYVVQPHARRAHSLESLGEIGALEPHLLRPHIAALKETLPDLVLGAPVDSSRAATTLLASLPACAVTSTAAELWSDIVRNLLGSLASASSILLGSVCDEPLPGTSSHAYSLPLPALPGDCVSTQRDALIRALEGCVEALHLCLRCGAGFDPSGARRVVLLPLSTICDLALELLSYDGSLPLPVPSVGALSHSAMLDALPDLHANSCQLLASVLSIARSHTMAYSRQIGQAIARVLQRSGRGGMPHLQCMRLRVCAYTLASNLCVSHGPCAAYDIVEMLSIAISEDILLQQPNVDSTDESDPTNVNRKRSRTGKAVLNRATAQPASWYSPEPVRCASSRAAASLLSSAGNLLPAKQRQVLQRAIIVGTAHAIYSRKSASFSIAPLSHAATESALISAISAVVASGEAHPSTIAMAIFILGNAMPHSGSGFGVHTALHALDAVIHPSALSMSTNRHSISMPTVDAQEISALIAKSDEAEPVSIDHSLKEDSTLIFDANAPPPEMSQVSASNAHKLEISNASVLSSRSNPKNLSLNTDVNDKGVINAFNSDSKAVKALHISDAVNCAPTYPNKNSMNNVHAASETQPDVLVTSSSAPDINGSSQKHHNVQSLPPRATTSDGNNIHVTNMAGSNGSQVKATVREASGDDSSDPEIVMDGPDD